MAFNRNFPNQQAFKRFDKLELVNLVRTKEAEGWEMVKRIYEERIIDKDFKAVDRNRNKWAFAGDKEIVKYVAVMTYKGRGTNEHA